MCVTPTCRLTCTQKETNMKFAVGDVVMLKSGGPALTIANASAESVTVIWYADSEDNFRTTQLPVDALVLFDEEDHFEDEEENDDVA